MTAVEFLHSEYKRILDIVTPEQVLKMADALAQAKEIEKQNIIDAYKNGKYESDKIVMSDRFYAEQYYNETFKNK